MSALAGPRLSGSAHRRRDLAKATAAECPGPPSLRRSDHLGKDGSFYLSTLFLFRPPVVPGPSSRFATWRTEPGRAWLSGLHDVVSQAVQFPFDGTAGVSWLRASTALSSKDPFSGYPGPVLRRKRPRRRPPVGSKLGCNLSVTVGLPGSYSTATCRGEQVEPSGGLSFGPRASAERVRPAIRLIALRKSYGHVVAADGVDLEIAEGEFFTMLGPSGSGKTTLLRIIAGFERPDSGTVELGGADVTRQPPYARDVNTVFQDYALFPHMTVIENVEYGLKIRKVPKAERATRAPSGCSTWSGSQASERRKPLQLSGGQRQRVALARAIVNEPEVLLLDEPLGALDLKLRQEMQTELKRIQREVGITFIYVTHDQEEALTMSDRLAVMSGGQIEQIGTPDRGLRAPATEFVAGFIGVSNLIDRDGHRLTVRPEKVHLLLDEAEPAPAGAHVESGIVDEVVYLGVVTRYRVELDGGGQLVAVRQNLETAAAEALEARGRRVRVAWHPDQAFRIGTLGAAAAGGMTDGRSK